MQKDSINLFQGDCLKLLKSIPENSIDLIITDPPYNISRKNNFHTLLSGRKPRQGMDFGNWDKDFDQTGYIRFLPRILKDNANVVIFNTWSNLAEINDALKKNNIIVKRCLVLSKSNPAPFNRDRLFVNDVEFALWGIYNSKNKPQGWTFNRQEAVEKCVIPTTVQSSKLHPTMKDLKVITKLVELLSNENDTVLDMFMGSGTTGVACINTNRKFIGMELDEKYFNIAQARIKEHLKEGTK